MRRLPQTRKVAEANASHRRRRIADLPVVPTYQPDPAASPTPPPETTQEDPSEEAVRRMVEAAYT